MKNLILALALTTASFSAVAAPPAATVVNRLETAPVYGRAVAVNEKDGTTTLVQLEEVADDRDNLRIAAYDHTGRIILETKAMRPRPGESLLISSADRNEAGDLVVITNYSRNTATSGVIYSDNLTTGISARLVEGSFPRVMDRIRVNGQNLVLTSVDLGRGPDNTHPVLLRLLDEDNAKVLKQIVLDEGVSAKLGLNSAGQPVAILFGYEIFGLLDLGTGQMKELVDRRRQPSQYPGQLHLSIGDFITLSGKQTMRLLDIKALMDGKLKVIRTFARDTAFLGGDPATIAVERKGEQLIVSDLATGRVLGPAINGGKKGRAERAITSITGTPVGLVAVVSELKEPNSFLPGTILTYVKLATGEVIRRTEVDKDLLREEVFVQNGRVLSAELKSNYLGNSVKLVDLLANKEISSSENLLLRKALQSKSGRILVLKENEKKQICVVDIESHETSCLADPLLSSDGVRYGARPEGLKESGTHRLVLTLTSGDEKRLQERGFVEIELE